MHTIRCDVCVSQMLERLDADKGNSDEIQLCHLSIADFLHIASEQARLGVAVGAELSPGSRGLGDHAITYRL
jgi:hypothetical protein